MKKQEKRLTLSEYNFTLESHLRTAVVVDFMSFIQRYPTLKTLKTFNDLFSISSYTILHTPCVEDIDIVYGSYLEDSIKECERICWCSSYELLEFINLKTTTQIPVQMDCFWVCGKNKEAFKKFRVISSKVLAARVSIV